MSSYELSGGEMYGGKISGQHAKPHKHKLLESLNIFRSDAFTEYDVTVEITSI